MRSAFPRFVVSGLAAFLLGLAAQRASAHEWYPWSCCSDQDCWATGEGRREPDPIVTANGWKLFDGSIVPFHQARPSPDGRFHVCRKGGQKAGAVIEPYGEPRCLWTPQQSF